MAAHVVHAPPDGYHDNCGDCQSQYLSVDVQQQNECRYIGAFTDAEAEAEIQTILDDLTALREEIKAALQSHGDLVLTRWTKKSKDKRAAILASTDVLEPLATAPVAHDQERDQWMRSNGNIWLGARWLSIKPFSEDRMQLLSLLHVRAAYPPAAWALLDTRESFMSFGHAWEAAPSNLYFNAKCVKMYGPGYGELVEWDCDSTHSWACIGFPRAFHTLTVQQEILMFLVQMLANIIQDSNGTGNAKWLTMVSGGFRASGSEALWSSYTHPALAPPTIRGFDPQQMLDKAQARLDVVLDDIWLMQTDPAYMHYTLRCRKASITCSDTATPSTDVRWDYLATDLLMDVIHRLSMWHIIVLACKKTLAAFSRNAADIELGRPVPADVNETLDVLSSEIGGRMQLQGDIFDKLLPSMRPLKSCFTAYQSGGSMGFDLNSNLNSGESGDRLAYHLIQIQDAVVHGPNMYGLSFHFDLLERELLAQGTSSQVDPRMYDQLSDIMVLDEMLQLCVWNQYGHANLRPDLAQLTPQQRHQRTVSRYQRGGIRLTERCIRSIATLMRSFSDTPWPKSQRKDLVWWRAATASRKRLLTLWDAIREEIRHAQQESGMDMARSAIGMITFDREPEYLAELERERQQCEEVSRLADAVAAQAASRAARQLVQTTWGESSDESQSRPSARKQTKAKAARAADASKSDDSGTESEKKDAEPAKVQEILPDDSPILVKVDSMSVFHKMFPSDSGTAGSVRWINFVQAMADAGFTATETGGSTFAFSSDVGTITIHRPHGPAFDPDILRGIGKRMEKRFDWSIERFQVRVKESKA